MVQRWMLRGNTLFVTPYHALIPSNILTVLHFCVLVQRWETSDWLEVWIAALGKWRSTVTAAGDQFVITAGTKTWPPWCAPCCSAVPSPRNSPRFLILSPTTRRHLCTFIFVGIMWVSGSAKSTSTTLFCALAQNLLASSVMVSVCVADVIQFYLYIHFIFRWKWKNTGMNVLQCF